MQSIDTGIQEVDSDMHAHMRVAVPPLAAVAQDHHGGGGEGAAPALDPALRLTGSFVPRHMMNSHSAMKSHSTTRNVKKTVVIQL